MPSSSARSGPLAPRRRDQQRSLHALEVLAATQRPLRFFVPRHASEQARDRADSGDCLAGNQQSLSAHRRAIRRHAGGRRATAGPQRLRGTRPRSGAPVMHGHRIPRGIANLEGPDHARSGRGRSNSTTAVAPSAEFTWAPPADEPLPMGTPEEAVEAGTRGAQRDFGLGAVCLILGEMGFEPLKPVGEPDAANSRIRFDVRLGGSFAGIVRCTVSEVAKLSRLRVRPGTVSAPGRASRYCGRGRRGPTRWRPSRRRARETDGSRAPA